MITEVLSRLEALGCGPRRCGRGWIARCPAHDDRKPSLSVREVDGRVRLHCFAGCDWREVRAVLELPDDAPREPRSPPRLEIDEARRAWLVETFEHAAPACRVDLARRYLAGRGLDPDALDSLGWPDWRVGTMRFEDGRRHPALLARFVSPEGTMVGLHATFLDVRARKLDRRTFGFGLGLSGSHLGLWPLPDDDPIQVAEGIEDAMAVACWSRRPCVAAGSAGLLAALVLPAGRRVVVYADADEAGLEAAMALHRRHGTVDVVAPTDAGDPCEALVARARGENRYGFRLVTAVATSTRG